MIAALQRIDSDAAVVLADERGKHLLSMNADRSMIPASIIKIVIVQAAYDLLGRDFRFKTEFYLNSDGTLTIKGWGDPFLISEEIAIITRQLADEGLTRVKQLRLDNSAFSEDVTIPGTSNSLNPYDALNGALVVNFNTLFVGKGRDGKIYSAEEHTPLTPLAASKALHLPPGHEERINLTDNPAESLEYAGQLFAALMRVHNITIDHPAVLSAETDEKRSLLLRHFNSKSLDEIFSGLMKYSNNYIANQVFLVIGAEQAGYPASLETSRAVLKDYLKQRWGFASGEIHMDEASGISRLNRMTARQMMAILETFRENSDLLSGPKGLKIKSGTLTGVYNYAGYFQSPSGLRPFVIMTENRVNRRDQLLKELRHFSDNHQ